MLSDVLTFAEIGGVFVGFAALIMFATEQTTEEKWMLISTVLGGANTVLSSLVVGCVVVFVADPLSAVRFSAAALLFLYFPTTAAIFGSSGLKAAKHW